MPELASDYFGQLVAQTFLSEFVARAPYDPNVITSVSAFGFLPDYDNQDIIDFDLSGMTIEKQDHVSLNPGNTIVTIDEAGTYDIKFSVTVRSSVPGNLVTVSQTIGPGSGTIEFMRDDFVIPGDPSNSVQTVSSNDVLLENKFFNAGDTIDFRLGCTGSSMQILAISCIIEPS